MTIDIAFNINGKDISLGVATNRTLADLLRDDLYLTGCRIACDEAVCGSCTVLVDGVPVAACSTFAFEIDRCRVETIESLASADGGLHPIQQAFLDADAFQCGFCTAGMIMSVKVLLAADASPDDAAIRDWLKASICRCTGYQSIIDATQIAARKLRESA